MSRVGGTEVVGPVDVSDVSLSLPETPETTGPFDQGFRVCREFRLAHVNKVHVYRSSLLSLLS